MAREVEVSNGEKIIVRNPGLGGEIKIFDLISKCQPLLAEFQSKSKELGGMTDVQAFFECVKLLLDHWSEVSEGVIDVICEVTSKPREWVERELTLGDRVLILQAGWEVMGLGKLMAKFGIKIAKVPGISLPSGASSA